MEESPKPMTKYAQTLLEKRARVRTKERGLREAYGMELLSPEQMKAELRKLAEEQIKELPCECYH